MALPVQFDHLPNRPALAGRVAGANLPASLFDTGRLPPAQRFGAWRQSIDVLLDTTLTVHESQYEFTASVESYLIDGIMLSRCAAGKQRFTRPVRKFARDGIDHYMIQLFIRGGVDMRRGRQFIRGDEGRVVAFDCADVLDSVNSDFDLLSIFIPRRRLAPLLRRPDWLHGVCPDPDSGIGRILTSFYLDLYLNAPWLAERDAKVMADTLVTLVAQAMNNAAPRDLSLDDTTSVSLLRARTFIRQHLGDGRLDEAGVAAATGMAEQEVVRLFEPVGGLQAFLREQRLRRAAARLMEGDGASLSCMAVETGFPGLEAFTRAFRARFSCSPEDIWSGATPIGRPDREAMNPICGDRTYEDWIVCLA